MDQALKKEIKREYKKLRRNYYFSNINKLICLASVFSFFHLASCLGQQKEIPTASKVGSGVFVVTVANAIRLRAKEENTKANIEKIHTEYLKAQKQRP